MQSTKERLLVAVARYAKGKKGPVSARAFCRVAGVSHQLVHTHFGGFGKLLLAAGLGGAEHKRMRIPEEELLAELHLLAEKLGRYPKILEIGAGRFSWSVYTRRFGKTRAVREVYERWKRARGGGPTRGWQRPEREAKGEFPLGEPVGHKWVLHAPTTEAGVIHLFGLLAPELGYAVAGVRGAFPDCLAYKAGTLEPDRWKPVRIEFELKSSNFAKHGHDPKGCDEIVCWEDDWKGCPVKVVELKRELEKAGGRSK